MNETKLTSKYILKIAILYGFIVLIVNYLGYKIASSGSMPVVETKDYRKWILFINSHTTLMAVLSTMAFLIPSFVLILYPFSSRKNKTKRFINLPFAYSAIGSLGWVISFSLECICLLCVKMNGNFKIADIITTSFLNMFQESIFIFTLVYLILDFCHRKFVLPQIFPNGQLGQYMTSVRPSMRFIVHIFYLSVCVFPVFFLTSTMVTLANNHGLKIGKEIYFTLIFIFVLSVIILWAFSDYLNTPLKKLKLGTEKVKAGEYTHHVDIVSNDAFGDLADTFNDMTRSLDEKTKKIIAVQDSVIMGMAVMVESRDNSTGGHINRTSDCVRVFVDKLVTTEKYKNLSPEFCKSVIKAAPMHDLGKIAVDDAILRKPGKFTDEEYAIMKTHSAEGARIVEKVLSQVDDEDFKRIAINVAHYHHEKWNGTGYPEGISGENIPLEARIMALADVFDALVSKRCYKDSYSYDKAFGIIEESLGTHFDPELGKAFIDCRQELQALYEGYGA